MYAKFEIAID
jgi:growth arrest-specific protein 8